MLGVVNDSSQVGSAACSGCCCEWRWQFMGPSYVNQKLILTTCLFWLGWGGKENAFVQGVVHHLSKYVILGVSVCSYAPNLSCIVQIGKLSGGNVKKRSFGVRVRRTGWVLLVFKKPVWVGLVGEYQLRSCWWWWRPSLIYVFWHV